MTARDWYYQNLERERAKSRERMARSRATDPDFRARQDARNRAYAVANKESVAAYQKEWKRRNPDHLRKWHMAHPGYHMLKGAQARAKKLGLAFNLTLADIVVPERCPVLGIVLKSAPHRKINPGSPSLDRIIPSLGYVRGNVRVISHRANSIKQNADAAELIRVANWLVREEARVAAQLSG